MGIILNLALLGFFKYTDFFLENFALFTQLLHLDFSIPLPHVLLPLALSFVTFQQIAFLVDCYTKTKHDIHTPMQSSNPTHHTIDFIDYCLFITFFPQLIAGPIVHHKEMMPQFKRLHTKNTKDVSLNTMCESNCTIAASLPPKITPTTPQSTNCIQDTRILEGTIQSSKDLDCANFIESTNTTIKNNSFYESIAKGLFIFSIGLFKKVCIADSFAVWANAGYSAVQKGQILNLFESWATSLSYTFELYFDFSGYCDMAIGLGLLFGIVLPRNFNSPYKALSITDFWRRWHITLGRFLKEYVYIPLGGNRNEKYKNALHYVLINKILTLRNLFIVAFLSGIWHGAGWGFIIWGCMHGVAMVVHRIYTWWYEGLESKSKQFLSNTKAFNDMEACGIDTQYTTHPKFHTTSSASVNPHTSPMAKNLTMHQLSSCVSTQQDNHALCSTTQRYSFARIYLGFMKTKLYTVLCWILTFNFVNIAWVFFRAENIQGAMNLLKGMFGGVIILPKFLESKLGFVHAWETYGVGIRFGEWAQAISESSYIVIGALFGVFVLVIVCKNSAQLTISLIYSKTKAITLSALLAFCVMYINQDSPFLYFNF